MLRWVVAGMVAGAIVGVWDSIDEMRERRAVEARTWAAAADERPVFSPVTAELNRRTLFDRALKTRAGRLGMRVTVSRRAAR